MNIENQMPSIGTAFSHLLRFNVYAVAPSGETPEEGQARRGGRRFTLAEARDERIKARALVKQGINPARNRQLERIKREPESATTFEVVANEWLALKDWEEITKKRRLDMLIAAVILVLGNRYQISSN